jgi:hypothetical protein
MSRVLEIKKARNGFILKPIQDENDLCIPDRVIAKDIEELLEAICEQYGYKLGPIIARKV